MDRRRVFGFVATVLLLCLFQIFVFSPTQGGLSFFTIKSVEPTNLEMMILSEDDSRLGASTIFDAEAATSASLQMCENVSQLQVGLPKLLKEVACNNWRRFPYNGTARKPQLRPRTAWFFLFGHLRSFNITAPHLRASMDSLPHGWERRLVMATWDRAEHNDTVWWRSGEETNSFRQSTDVAQVVNSILASHFVGIPHFVAILKESDEGKIGCDRFDGCVARFFRKTFLKIVDAELQPHLHDAREHLESRGSDVVVMLRPDVELYFAHWGPVLDLLTAWPYLFLNQVHWIRRQAREHGSQASDILAMTTLDALRSMERVSHEDFNVLDPNNPTEQLVATMARHAGLMPLPLPASLCTRVWSYTGSVRGNVFVIENPCDESGFHASTTSFREHVIHTVNSLACACLHERSLDAFFQVFAPGFVMKQDFGNSTLIP